MSQALNQLHLVISLLNRCTHFNFVFLWIDLTVCVCVCVRSQDVEDGIRVRQQSRAWCWCMCLGLALILSGVVVGGASLYRYYLTQVREALRGTTTPRTLLKAAVNRLCLVNRILFLLMIRSPCISVEWTTWRTITRYRTATRRASWRCQQHQEGSRRE